MVVIRLNRGGSKKRPKYRITVADSRRWLGGKFLEVIGHYNPSPRGQEQKIVIDTAKADDWIAKGAIPTPRVMTLIRQAKGLPTDANHDKKRQARIASNLAKKPKHEGPAPKAEA
jgi:small subunit ribosomal protein S16